MSIRLFLRSIPTYPVRLMSSGNHFFPAEKTSMFRHKVFADRTALVTGGGSGLGRSMAKLLVTLGANVFIVSRREEILKSVCEEIGDEIGVRERGGNINYAAADVRDPEAVRHALDKCREKFGVPDLIVNNAAANFLSPTERLSMNAFGTIVDIVLKGTANVTLQTAKDLIAAKKPGTFLAITTVYAKTGSAFVVPSAAAKAGVEAMVKSLAVEWSRFGLRFNAIAPGPIYTKGAFSRLDPTGEFAKYLPERIPAQRLGSPEELANLAAYLLSDYSSWLNGQVINFDGGETVALAGEFNEFLKKFSDKDWDAIEQLIRKNQQKSS